MNINKWRVVRHQFHERPLMYPWHVYPPGVAAATNDDELAEIYSSRSFAFVYRGHAEAIAHAHQKATAQNL